MTAVARGIDQDIIRLDLQTALNNGFQIFVLHLKFLKGQIIHINDEFVIAVLDTGNDTLKILELMLIDLNHAQPLVIVFI